MDTFSDQGFIDVLVGLAPFLAVGVLLGIIVAIIGWLWGFVIRLSRFEP